MACSCGRDGTGDEAAPWARTCGRACSTSRPHTPLWSRTRTDLVDWPDAIEIDSQGALDVAVWGGPCATWSFLLMHEGQAAMGVATPPFDPNIPSGPARMPSFAAVKTETSGRVLFSTDFAGTYCEKH